MSVVLRTPHVLTLLDVASAPAAELGIIKLYVLPDGGGNVELFIRDAVGNDAQLTDSGRLVAGSLKTSTGVVTIDSAAPEVGFSLVATSETTATWQAVNVDGAANALNTVGAPVDVSNAAPPVSGQVLMAASGTAAFWRVPGLHYDPSIKFWTSSTGSASIEPNTWGFIEQPPLGADSVTAFIVSSLLSPPVDSRFALYVGLDVTVPIKVQVIGASEIQGIDNVRGPTTELLPGAYYEWIFYHEDGAALWGIVSDTAGVAKRLRVSGQLVDITASATPTAGQALIATDATHAEFSDVPTAFAGAGLTKNGNTLNVSANPDGSIVANADDIQVGVINDTQHGTRGGGAVHSTATTSVAGFMSAADKSALGALGPTPFSLLFHSTALVAPVELALASFDATPWGASAIKLAAFLECSGPGQTCSVLLRNLTTATDVCTLTRSATTPAEVVSSALSLPSSSCQYSLRIWITGGGYGDRVACRSAKFTIG